MKRYFWIRYLIYYLNFVPVSVHSIATPIGAILAGPLMEEFGRKATLQLSVIPMVLGWIFISLTPNATWLILGRLLAGFAVGMGPAPSQVGN